MLEMFIEDGFIVLHIVYSFRSEFLTGHSLKIFGCVAFIHYFNAEHSLDYILTTIIAGQKVRLVFSGNR